MSKCIIVLFICVFLYPECFCMYCTEGMSCISVLSVLYLNIAIQARGLASHKTIFVLYVPSQVREMAVRILLFDYMGVTFVGCFFVAL